MNQSGSHRTKSGPMHHQCYPAMKSLLCEAHTPFNDTGVA